MSRWGERSPGTFAIKGVLTPEQLHAYALHSAIGELTNRIETGNFDRTARAEDHNEPVYDSYGRQTNTRAQVLLESAKLERTKLVRMALATIPGYKPPQKFRKYEKTSEKLFLPVRDHPDINFVGLLLGPRGKTLQRMEKESGARIAIRGRGSVRQASANALKQEREDLHCIIHGDSEFQVNKAIELINEVVQTGVKLPDHANTHKMHQLKELATINGTLRDDSQMICTTCGIAGHRRSECPSRESVTTSLVCRNCGGVGHFARDCLQPRSTKTAAEIEYERLMSELKPDLELPHKPPHVSPESPANTEPNALAPPGASQSTQETIQPPGVSPPGVTSPLKTGTNSYGPPVSTRGPPPAPAILSRADGPVERRPPPPPAFSKVSAPPGAAQAPPPPSAPPPPVEAPPPPAVASTPPPPSLPLGSPSPEPRT